MFSNDGYCEAWSDDLKEARRKWRNAVLRVHSLENYIVRVDPEQFDDVLILLEKAEEEARAAAKEYQDKRRTWNLQTMTDLTVSDRH